MIKIGFIGFGRFAQLRYELIKSCSDVEVVGYYDVVKKSKSELSYYHKSEELIENVDAVFISVPPAHAPKFCYKSLKKEVHVFCEKPPAISSNALQQISNLSSDKVLAYGFNHRQHDSIIKIKQIVESKDLGNIIWMRGRYGKEVDELYSSSWRSNKELNGGGILIDQGIHLLDIMDMLAGGFDYNQSILSDSFLNIKNVEDNAFINLASSKTKISGSLHSTITQWRYLFSLEIFLSKGSLILNGLKTSSGNYGDEILTVRPENGGQYNESAEDTTYNYTNNNSWKREIDAFLDSIRHDVAYPFSGLKEAKNISKLIDSIYENAIWVR